MRTRTLNGWKSDGTFGGMLRQLRKRANLTQGEFGKQVGYSISQIARIEANKRRPKLCDITNRYIYVLGVANEPQTCEQLIMLAIGQGAKKE